MSVAADRIQSDGSGPNSKVNDILVMLKRCVVPPFVQSERDEAYSGNAAIGNGPRACLFILYLSACMCFGARLPPSQLSLQSAHQSPKATKSLHQQDLWLKTVNEKEQFKYRTISMCSNGFRAQTSTFLHHCSLKADNDALGVEQCCELAEQHLAKLCLRPPQFGHPQQALFKERIETKASLCISTIGFRSS